MSTDIKMIPISEVRRNPGNVRAQAEVAKKGVMPSLICQEAEDGVSAVFIAGNMRARAMASLGDGTVRANVAGGDQTVTLRLDGERWLIVRD